MTTDPLGLGDIGPAQLPESGPGGPRTGLAGVGYLADEGIAGVVYLADRLAKPVGFRRGSPPGPARPSWPSFGQADTGSRLIRLQCYEGLDESKALYEWNYRKQLLRIQAGQVLGDDEAAPGPGATTPRPGRSLEEDASSRRTSPAHPAAPRGPPGRRADRVADRRGGPRRARDRGAPLGDPLRVPGLHPRARHGEGEATADGVPHLQQHPRASPRPCKRRCLYLHINYPDLDRDSGPSSATAPGITDELADQVARIVRSLRTIELRKLPSVSETLDWARTLVVLGITTVDATAAKDSLNILLKYKSDIDKAAKELLAANEA